MKQLEINVFGLGFSAIYASILFHGSYPVLAMSAVEMSPFLWNNRSSWLSVWVKVSWDGSSELVLVRNGSYVLSRRHAHRHCHSY